MIENYSGMTTAVAIGLRPAVRCGSSGTLSWRFSRSGLRNKLLCSTGERSSFQLSVSRAGALASEGIDVSLIVGAESHRFQLLERLPELDLVPKAALVERLGWAPSLEQVAFAACEAGADRAMVSIPRDQTVTDPPVFILTVLRATFDATGGRIVILLATQDRSHTAHGYFQSANAVPRDMTFKLFLVGKFFEEFDLDTSRPSLAEGGDFRNGRMFAQQTSVWA